MTDGWIMDTWGVRARQLLEQARAEVEGGIDAIPTVEAALAVLRIEAGEAPNHTMDGYSFPDEEPDVTLCICPPDLVERGGFRSGCPIHGA
jgi:hypothetical protein